MPLSDYPIIELDSVDSTNNYAMQLIDANKAQPGTAIVAQSQWAGKGQRGKTWMDAPGESLLMSIITAPKLEIKDQFIFSATVAVVIANVLRKLDESLQINIKWPNDIIVNDKKAGGILIENVLRGSHWTHAIIGLGLNVKQSVFPQDLPYATSLKIASAKGHDIIALRSDIIATVMAAIEFPTDKATVIDQYNLLLYRRGLLQAFSIRDDKWMAKILNAHSDGTLELERENGDVCFYQHGQVLWEWGI